MTTNSAKGEDAASGGTPDATGDRRDLVILGVGSAAPRAVAALSKALDLPIETVVDAVYRAPARLLANLRQVDAERLVEMIAALGLEAAALKPGQVPPRGATFDIAGRIVDPEQAEPGAAALAAFLGTTPAAALDMLVTPPGILIGNVSVATLAGLESALPPGAIALTAADPQTSRYALFAAALTRPQASALQPFLPPGAGIADAGNATIFDLDRETADRIWRRLKAPESVRIVNQAFLHFTIVLHSLPGSGGDAGGAYALETLAGVPAGQYPLLAAALPVPIADGVAYDDVPLRLAAFAAAGFGATAELATFASVALDVLAASAGALAETGLTARPPFRTAPMPAARAHLLRARLEAAGADVMAAV